MKGIFKLALITASMCMAGTAIAVPGNTGTANINFAGNVVDTSCTINAADMVHNVAMPDISEAMFNGANWTSVAGYEAASKLGNSATFEVRFENCPSSQTKVTPVASITTGQMGDAANHLSRGVSSLIPEGTAKGYYIMMSHGDRLDINNKAIKYDGTDSPSEPIVANAATYKVFVTTLPSRNTNLVKQNGDYNATVDLAFNYS